MSPSLCAIPDPPHGPPDSTEESAKRDSCELHVRDSALQGRFTVNCEWANPTAPEADNGRLDAEPHAFGVTGSWDWSLPAVDGRVPLPPDEGRAVLTLERPHAPALAGGDEENVADPQALPDVGGD